MKFFKGRDIKISPIFIKYEIRGFHYKYIASYNIYTKITNAQYSL